MIIGVISDTHRISSYINKVIDALNKEEVDLIMHLGDNVQDIEEIEELTGKKVINVKGNCDFFTETPSDRVEVVGNKTIFLTHGHNYNVKMDLNRLKYKALEVGANIALYGHTHIADIVYQEGIWFINPGSVSASRLGPNSYAIIHINENNIEPSIMEL